MEECEFGDWTKQGHLWPSIIIQINHPKMGIEPISGPGQLAGDSTSSKESPQRRGYEQNTMDFTQKSESGLLLLGCFGQKLGFYKQKLWILRHQTCGRMGAQNSAPWAVEWLSTCLAETIDGSTQIFQHQNCDVKPSFNSLKASKNNLDFVSRDAIPVNPY